MKSLSLRDRIDYLENQIDESRRVGIRLKVSIGKEYAEEDDRGPLIFELNQLEHKDEDDLRQPASLTTKKTRHLRLILGLETEVLEEHEKRAKYIVLLTEALA